MKELLAQSDDGFAIGAFNVSDMEMAMGAIKAAEELNAPLILQIAEGRLRYSPLELLGPVMIAAARKCTMPTAVHLDHGRTLETVRLALSLGFTSVFLLTQPYEQVEKDFIAHCSFLKTMGARFCNVAEQGNSVQGKLDVPVFEGKPENTAEQWKLLTEGLDKLGKVAKDMGMTMTYHHHMGTGVQTEAEIDRLMENTNPDYVWLLYDTGHLVCSGEDYLGILKKYMSRIRHIHLKDVRLDVRQRVIDEKMSFLDGVRAGMFTVPGDGDVDFEPIFDYVNKSDFDGWYIVEAEQDPAKANPLEYAQKARKYIREKAGL
jgi:inosose dehydratase